MRSSITAFVLTGIALAAVPFQSAANHARASNSR